MTAISKLSIITYLSFDDLINEANETFSLIKAYQALEVSTLPEGEDCAAYDFTLSLLRDTSESKGSCFDCPHAEPSPYGGKLDLDCSFVSHIDPDFEELVYRGTSEDNAGKIAAKFCGGFYQESALERDIWSERNALQIEEIIAAHDSELNPF